MGCSEQRDLSFEPKDHRSYSDEDSAASKKFMAQNDALEQTCHAETLHMVQNHDVKSVGVFMSMHS